MTIEYRTSERFPTIKVGSDGSIIGPSGRVLKPYTGGYYPTVNVRDGSKRGKTMRVPVLVCETFHGPRPPGDMVVRHLDGDPSNNASANLLWGTRKENSTDATAHGTHVRGTKHPGAKLNEDAVRDIRRRKANGETLRALALEFGVTSSRIWLVANGKDWAHVDS